jgi:Flp pilus assembly protein TadD
MMAKGDAKGAERAARQALQGNPSEARARYLLGMSLFSQRKFEAETIRTLRESQDRFPRAQLALAMTEALTGETTLAKRTLNRYLESNEPYMQAEVKQMLENLNARTMAATK